MDITLLKKESSAKHFASLFGKSTLSPDSTEYQIIKDITTCLIKQGYGVIHGGYTGGSMEAVNEAANEIINSNSLSPLLNIAVPLREHDTLWPRVKNASFTKVAKDIFERLKIITNSDIAVILPKGGFGTQLEWTIHFHENQIKQQCNKPTQPIIFYISKDGTDWRNLVKTILSELDLTDQSDGRGWLYFVESLREFEELIVRLGKS